MLQQRTKRKRYDELDEETHFGLQVAATIRRFNPRQKALAKLRIEQVLVDVEFPPEFPTNYYSTPTDYNQSSEM